MNTTSVEAEVFGHVLGAHFFTDVILLPLQIRRNQSHRTDLDAYNYVAFDHPPSRKKSPSITHHRVSRLHRFTPTYSLTASC